MGIHATWGTYSKYKVTEDISGKWQLTHKQGNVTTTSVFETKDAAITAMVLQKDMCKKAGLLANTIMGHIKTILDEYNYPVDSFYNILIDVLTYKGI